MPALPPYLPAKDAAFTSWLANFSTLISANAPAYGLMTSDAATIAAQNAAWTAAYGPITSPMTKTPEAISAKNVAKIGVQTLIRTYAQNIANNPGVSVNNKIALGLNPKTSTPSPITPPDTYPILSIQAGANRQFYVRYKDSATSQTSKAKPYGVASCQIFYAFSETPITLVGLLTQQVTATKSPIKIAFPDGSGGKQCYLAAYWLLKNGQQSDWGPIVSATVQLGS